MDSDREAAMLSDASLTCLANELGNEWRSLGIFLGLSKAQVDRCFTNHPWDVKAAIVDMLVMWQRETSAKGPNAQVADLVKALKDIGRVDLAERVEDGDFIPEHPDQVLGIREHDRVARNRECDQMAGNRVEARGNYNVIIQATNDARINVNVPAPGRADDDEYYGAAASAPPRPDSLPDFSRMRPPYPRPMPRAFSQDSIQQSPEDILNDCIRLLREMGFSDMGTCRQEVQNLISTGLRTPLDIVQKIVESNFPAQAHEETSGQQSSHVHSSKDGVTVSNNKGPVQMGEGNIISGVNRSSLENAVQIGKNNRILTAEDENLGRSSTHQQQSFPNNTQAQQDRFIDNTIIGEILSSERNRKLAECLPQDRAASQMEREVLPSDGQDWPPIPDDVSSSTEKSEASADTPRETSEEDKRETTRSYSGRHGRQVFSPAQLQEPGMSSTLDSLDGPTTGEGEAPHEEIRFTTPIYVARSPSKSSMAETQQGTSPQNPTGGSPDRPTDTSLSDDSLHLESGYNMQDNLASNQPETGITSRADDGEEIPVRPLVELYPESSQPSTIMDSSIPSMGPQWLPLSPLPAETNDEANNSDPQLTQGGEDENTEEPSDLSENQPTEPMGNGSGEDEETVPKAPPEEASANEEAEGAPVSDDQHPAEAQQQVNEDADGNQAVYDTERRLYIFRRAHIEEMTENFSPSKKIADGAFGPVYYLEKFPYEGPLKGRQMAVKVNRSDGQGRREFMQELAVARSRHPQLLPLFGICEDESRLSLVSPYMANKDLKSWILDKRSPTDWKTRLVISLDLISAIRHYHKQTVGPNKRFHCDVKSANVFLDAQHRARLGDPGLMREVSKDKTHLALTQTGSFIADRGTPYYQDPSCLKYHKYHETSDLYSAGKVLLELLTSITADKEENGRLLFEVWFEVLDYFEKNSDGTKLCEVADRSSTVDWPECNEDGTSVTQQFAKLIIHCLQERLKDRMKLEDLYQKLKELVQTSAAIGNHNKVVPDWCMYCLACKPCPIPMACGCALVCSACMKSHTEALYCPNHLKETTGLGYKTFAIIVGQSGFQEDAKGFKDVIINPHICGVREENVKLRLNASIEDVERAMAEVTESIQQVPKGQETFFIYYHSGHGLQRGLYFNKDAPVMSTKLKKILRRSKATKSLFILDSCMASSVEVYTMKGPEGAEGSTSSSGETEKKEEEQGHPGDNMGCQGSQDRDIYMLPEGSMLWASSRKTEASGKKDKNRLSVFTKYIIQGLQGGYCGADNCSHCMSFQHQARAVGAVNLNLLRDYVFDHVKHELQELQIPSLQGHQEKTYWMAYTQD